MKQAEKLHRGKKTKCEINKKYMEKDFSGKANGNM
jgi:hypothetical protein